jgi:hypothetical protein
MTNRNFTLTSLVASCLLVLILTCCKKKQDGVPALPTTPIETPPSTTTERRLWWDASEEQAIVESIQKRLKVHELALDEDAKLQPHQFLHLHHMKTGGTSMDHMMKCAMKRMEEDLNYTVPYYNIHECARGKFRRCVANDDDPCRHEFEDSAIMSYCAPMFHLDKFGWMDESVPAFTVLRQPVDRVWSMFRFETRSCYSCKNLTEIYDRIDRNDTNGLDGLCLAQLQNHEVTRLLTTDWPEDASEDDMLAEAVENMKSFFTVIGLTEELILTSQILGKVFPWLNTTIHGSRTYCQLPHDNGSPKNNHCIRNPSGKGDGTIHTTHWDLPSHPDEETRKAIEAHNQLDLRLYEAAVQYFELQKQAMATEEQES